MNNWSVFPNPVKDVFILTANTNLLNTNAQIVHAIGVNVKKIRITQLQN